MKIEILNRIMKKGSPERSIEQRFEEDEGVRNDTLTYCGEEPPTREQQLQSL